MTGRIPSGPADRIIGGLFHDSIIGRPRPGPSAERTAPVIPAEQDVVVPTIATAGSGCSAPRAPAGRSRPEDGPPGATALRPHPAPGRAARMSAPPASLFRLGPGGWRHGAGPRHCSLAVAHSAPGLALRRVGARGCRFAAGRPGRKPRSGGLGGGLAHAGPGPGRAGGPPGRRRRPAHARAAAHVALRAGRGHRLAARPDRSPRTAGHRPAATRCPRPRRALDRPRGHRRHAGPGEPGTAHPRAAG